MKMFGLVLIALLSQTAFAIECSYDKRAIDGGAATFSVVRVADGDYTINLVRVKGMSSETTVAGYEHAACTFGKNPLLFQCRVPMNRDGFEGSMTIASKLSWEMLTGDTITLTVDSDQRVEKAIGLVPRLKQVSASIDSCKL